MNTSFSCLLFPRFFPRFLPTRRFTLFIKTHHLHSQKRPVFGTEHHFGASRSKRYVFQYLASLDSFGSQ
jgi:hypothetical protein